MNRKQAGLARRGFTLVELLTVVALIILIVAMAVPNFASMMRERRWSSAVAALQNSILRIKAQCINTRFDHAIEFCQDDKGVYYLRLETESSFLERIPNLSIYYPVVAGSDWNKVPLGWQQAFQALRNAWDSSGNRLGTGINLGTKFYYDGRGGYLDKTALPAGLSSERSNLAPFLDVNQQPWVPSEKTLIIKDNLAVDDKIYLPYDIKLDDALSTNLINFDEWNALSMVHGWDNTKDLRFDKVGYLIQTQTPEIVLKRDTKYEPEHMRLRLLRGTGRLQTLEGLN